MKFDDLENLLSLHGHEEKLRADSISIINADASMIESVALVANAMNIFFGFTHDHEHLDDDELTLQFFGLRQFNTAACSIKLALSGYTQTAISLTRDILEVAFLLDFFRTDRAKIQEWKKATKQERKKNFSPVAIRTAIDERDGYKEKKRAKVYALLSEYASHVTYDGFKLLKRDGLGELGPFISEKHLAAWLQEIVLRLVPSASVFAAQFPNVSAPLNQLRKDYNVGVRAWQAKHFKK